MWPFFFFYHFTLIIQSCKNDNKKRDREKKDGCVYSCVSVARLPATDGWCPSGLWSVTA